MLDKSKYIQKLITYIPLISKLLDNGFIYREIANILKTEYNVVLDSKSPSGYISNTIYRHKNNLLNNSFEKYNILKVPYNDKTTYDEFCAEYEFGFYITYKNVKINDDYLITENNIHTIADIKGCLVAKRFLRLHMIPDAKIIADHKEKYNISDFGNNDEEFIASIHDKIIDEFEKLTRHLRMKPFFYKGLI